MHLILTGKMLPKCYVCMKGEFVKSNVWAVCNISYASTAEAYITHLIKPRIDENNSSPN